MRGGGGGRGGGGERAVEFRRLDEAKCNAPEVLVGDADIGGVAPHEKCVYFGEVAAGSRWMFALREVEKEALKSPVRLDVAFTAPDGTGGERYWVLRNGHGGGWRPRPGGGCLDGKEGASGLFFAANEAEWAELKGIAMLMGKRGGTGRRRRRKGWSRRSGGRTSGDALAMRWMA